MRTLALLLLVFAASARSAEPNEAFDAAEALIRYAATSSPLVDEKPDICLTVEGEKNLQPLLARLQDVNLHIVPCGGKAIVTHLSISRPRQEPDGNFRVSYGYFIDCKNCSAQGKVMLATMSHDRAGWHVLNVQGSVSL